MMAMPMRTCPALHGWRRYGKRSPARRAIPQTTISSESPLFSRCFRCSRKRHAKQANRSQDTPVSGDKGIRGGQEDEILEEEKDEEDGGRRSEEARQKGCREEGQEGSKEGKKAGEETSCEEGRNEGCKKICEESDSEGQASDSAGAGRRTRQHLLHHDRDRLSERPASHRSRLRGDRDRRAGAF